MREPASMEVFRCQKKKIQARVKKYSLQALFSSFLA
jgi:hypothetical protein